MSKYHCPTSGKIVNINKDDNRAALQGIWGCRHMTPASVAEMDAKLGVGTTSLTEKPDVDADWEAMEAEEANPPASAFDYD